MRRIGTLLILVFVITLQGCLTLKQPSHKIDYYTLEYETLPFEQKGKDIPLSSILRLERFSIAPLYNTDRIIFRDRDFKRTSYRYHRWRNNPADLVTFYLGRDMRNSGRFQAVTSYNSSIPYTHKVEGELMNSWSGTLTADGMLFCL